LSSLRNREQRFEAIKRIESEDASIPDLERTPDEVCLATFWRQATLGVSHWRCLVPARHLPGQMLGFDIGEVAWDDEADQLLLPRHRGVAIWSYLGDDARARIALAWQDLGHKTLMELDDNYAYSPKKWGINWAETHQDAQDIIGYSFEQNRHLAGLVDGIIVSTPYLGNVYSEFNDNIFVCRNSIDPADWQHVERHDDGIFRIGYAGSNVHVFDFPLVRKALKWAARQKDVEVCLMGFDLPPAWRGTMMPWQQDLPSYWNQLGLLDLGLAPLQDTPWGRSKSDIKAMEYAMAGAMPLVARTEAYRPWTDMGWPSARTENEWVELIQHAVRNRDWVKEQAAVAKEYVLNERTIQHEIIRWEEAIFDS
jgi:hypothetical protein